MFGINASYPETHFRKPNEVCMELTENGINDTNIKKLLLKILILKSSKCLIWRANQRVNEKKPHCKRLQQRENIFSKV